MKRNFFLIAAFVLMLLFSFPYSSFAIYQWVDEKGQFHITDYPKPSKEQDQDKEEKASPVGQTEPVTPVLDEQTVQPSTAPPEMRQPKQIESQPIPVVVQPSTGAQVKKPMDPAPQTGVQAVPPPAGQAVQPVPITSMPPAQATPRSRMPAFPAFPKGAPPEMLAAMLAGFMTVFLFAGAILYLYSALCLFLIAKKLDVPAAWTAWIPIIQVWAFFQSAGKSLAWILLFFIPIVNVIVSVYLWMCIAENLGKNKWLGLLTLVPIANLILPAILAFSKREGMTASSPAMA